MTFAINVKGGTGAGRKIQKQPTTWTHYCRDTRPATPAEMDEHSSFRIHENVRTVVLSTYSCGNCGARRPVYRVA